jgi:hypothetical protein
VAIAEYAPNLVKKTIIGVGHGDKAQIRMMVGVLLPRADPKTHDAADALAIAITHAHHRQSAVVRSGVMRESLQRHRGSSPSFPVGEGWGGGRKARHNW